MDKIGIHGIILPIKPLSNIELEKAAIQYNTDELQMRGSVVCGDFCLNVLKLLSEGQTFDEVVFSLLIYK